MQSISAHQIVITMAAPVENEKYYLEIHWELDKLTHSGYATIRINSNISFIPGSNSQYLQILMTFLSLKLDIVPVLTSFARNYQTRMQIESFLYSNMIHRSVLLHHLKTPIIAGKISVISQSIHHFRIIFFQTYALDVRLFGDSGIIFEDATTSELRENRELTKEMGVLKYMFQIIPGNNFSSAMFSLNANFAIIFENYYRYLGSCYMLQHLMSNKSMINHFNNTRLIIAHSFGSRDPPIVSIDIKSLGSQLQFGIDQSTGLITMHLFKFSCPALADVAKVYFTNFIACPPYRPEHLASFINLFDTPIPIMEGFKRLFEYAISPGPTDAISFLVSWDTIQIDPIGQTILVELIFFEKNQFFNRLSVPIRCTSSNVVVLMDSFFNNESLINIFRSLNAENIPSLLLIVQKMIFLPIEEFRQHCMRINQPNLIKNGT